VLYHEEQEEELMVSDWQSNCVLSVMKKNCLDCKVELVDALSVTVRPEVLTALFEVVDAVSVPVRPVVLTALVEVRFESWCQQALKSLLSTIDDLVLEPKGGYVQYDHNNHKYYYVVLHGGDKEGRDSEESRGTWAGSPWRTGLSDIDQGPQTFGRARR